MMGVEYRRTLFNFAGLASALILMFGFVSGAGGRMAAQNQPFLSSQTTPPQTPGSSGQDQKQAFDDRAATKLLMQLTQGLEDGNQKQVLAVFDFVHMQGGELYQQQLISFLSHAESIRLHMNLVGVTSDGGKSGVEADFEMEIAPRDGTLPVRKQAKMNFSVQGTSNGWKFVDVQPRRFFSTDAGQ